MKRSMSVLLNIAFAYRKNTNCIFIVVWQTDPSSSYGLTDWSISSSLARVLALWILPCLSCFSVTNASPSKHLHHLPSSGFFTWRPSVFLSMVINYLSCRVIQLMSLYHWKLLRCILIFFPSLHEKLCFQQLTRHRLRYFGQNDGTHSA